MYLPSEGFFSEFKYVEVASYVPSIKSVIRLQDKNKDPILLDSSNEVNKYFKKKGLIGAYTSIWRRKTKSIPNDPHLLLAPLYFDLDDKEDINKPLEQLRTLREYFINVIPEEAIQLYFTGYKGFHLEINPIVFNATPSALLPEIYKYICDDVSKQLNITTRDSQVTDSRRMWRLPNSIHQETKLYKVQIWPEQLNDIDKIKQYAEKPHHIIDGPVMFNAKAAEWFYELKYRYEDIQSESFEDRIKRFEKKGSYKSININNTDLEFIPQAIWESPCKFIQNMMEKVEKQHDLSHPERLSLCSLLSYTDESLEYLYYLLQNCLDFNQGKSELHIKDWIRRRNKDTGGRPMTCRWLQNNGIACNNCDKLEPKYKMITSIDGTLYETNEIADQSPIRFLYKRNKVL